MIGSILAVLFAAQACVVCYIYHTAGTSGSSGAIHKVHKSKQREVYSRAAVRKKFRELAFEIECAKTALIGRIHVERAVVLYREIVYLYKNILTNWESEELLYLKTQLEDTIASDIGRDDRYRRSAIEGYTRLAQLPNARYKRYAEERLTELRSVGAYINLRIARRLLYKTRGLRDTAVMKCCDAVISDPHAKEDMVIEALEMKIAALTRLGLKSDAKYEKQELRLRKMAVKSRVVRKKTAKGHKR